MAVEQRQNSIDRATLAKAAMDLKEACPNGGSGFPSLLTGRLSLVFMQHPFFFISVHFVEGWSASGHTIDRNPPLSIDG